MSTFLLNDSAPTTLAQEFDAPPAAWTDVYWGGPSSMILAAGEAPPVVTPWRTLMGVGLSLVLGVSGAWVVEQCARLWYS